VVAPSFLSDFYPPEYRNTVLTVFYLSMPLGAAVGFGIGGVLTANFGWEFAYLATGLPGIIIAFLMLFIKEPGFGAFDVNQSDTTLSWPTTMKIFLKRKLFVLIVLATTFQIFGIGGIADWLPAFYHRIFPDFSDNTSSLVVGGATFIGGVGGITLGGVLGEKIFVGRFRHPYIAVSAIGSYISVVFMCLFIFMEDFYVGSVFLTLSEVFYFTTTAPLNAQVANMMPATVRTRAYGMMTLVNHCFGDAISPTIIGLISDKSNNLSFAVSLVPLVMILSAMVLLVAWQFLDESEGTELVWEENNER